MSHQSIKDWNLRFAHQYSDGLRKHRRKPTRHWHVDEAFCKIRGKKHYIWTAVDSRGEILYIYVSDRRNKKEALAFFKRLETSYQPPTKVTTDRLRSYKSVVKAVFPMAKHRRGKWLNNVVEVAHIRTRERERKMQKFRSKRQAQDFLLPCRIIRSYLKPKQHLLPAVTYRRSMKYRLRLWNQIAHSDLIQ